MKTLVAVLAALLAFAPAAGASHGGGPPFGSCVEQGEPPRDGRPGTAARAYGPAPGVERALGDRYGGVFAKGDRWHFPLVTDANAQAARDAVAQCGQEVVDHTDYPAADFTWREYNDAQARITDATRDTGVVWGYGVGLDGDRFVVQIDIDAGASAEQEEDVRRRADEAARGVPWALRRGSPPVADRPPLRGPAPWERKYDRVHALAFGLLGRDYSCTELIGIANGEPSIRLWITTAASRPRAERVFAEAGVRDGQVRVVSPRLRYGTFATIRKRLAAQAPRGVTVLPRRPCGPLTLRIDAGASRTVRQWANAARKRYGADRVVASAQ